MFNKKLTIILILIFLSSIIGITIPCYAKKIPVIAYSGVNPRISFWKTIQTAIRQTSREKNMILLDYTKHDFSSDRQIRDIYKAVSQNVDMLIVGATSSKIHTAVDMAIDNGIPVITVDVNLRNPRVKCHIGTDNYEDTKKAGFFIISRLQKKNQLSGNILIVTGDKNNENAQLRANAVKEVMEQYGYHVNIFYSKDWTTSEALNHYVREFKRTDIDYCAAFATYADATVAMVEANMKYNKKDIVTVGYDSSKLIKKYIRENKLDALIEQDAYSIGKTAVDITPDIISNKSIDKNIHISTHMYESKKEY